MPDPHSSQSGDTDHIPPPQVKPPREPDEPPTLATLAREVECLSRRLVVAERDAHEGWEYGMECLEMAKRNLRGAACIAAGVGFVGVAVGALFVWGVMR